MSGYPEDTNLPNNFVQQYNLASKITKYGYVYVEIRRGMYDHPQSGLLAKQRLEKRLNSKGYQKSELIPGFLDPQMASYLLLPSCG